MAQEVQKIVRISRTDIDGTKKIVEGVKKVKGVGDTFANALIKVSGIAPEKKAGLLNDAEIEKIEEIISDPLKFGIPHWIVNRRKDRDTGTDKHLTSDEIDLAKEFDIRLMKKIRCYKGIRHAAGLPVRGQKTKSSFRSGAKIGVSRKKIREQKKDKKTKQSKEEKK